MSLLWREAVLMRAKTHQDLIDTVSKWPEKVHVTQAGFASHDQSTAIRGFLKNRSNQDSAWYRTEHVDLAQPIHSWQPHIVTSHLLRYIRNPLGPTQKVKRDQFSDGYAGDDHPCMVRHQGRLITTDGSHRVAAEMLRGRNRHMKTWVYDADKHGFPNSVMHDPPSDYPQHRLWHPEDDEKWDEPSEHDLHGIEHGSLGHPDDIYADLHRWLNP